MSGTRVVALLVAILVVGAIPRSHANPEDCQEVISEHKAAKDDIKDALTAYANCLSGNDGHDDCSSEFETLKSAQDDFEDAVSKYESECN
jgi:hypothetical protein